jgi:hypothetical protein
MAILIVHSRTSGRRRAGKRFSREPGVYDVTEAEEKAIRADSMLVVHKDEPKAVEPEKAPAAPVVEDKAPKRRFDR